MLKRRTLSAAARRRIADAQRKRWAATKAAAKAPAAKKVARKNIRKARKTLPEKVAITKIPPKQQRERKPQVTKSAKSALSGKSEIIAAPQSKKEA
jgi:hypothetical protein